MFNPIFSAPGENRGLQGAARTVCNSAPNIKAAGGLSGSVGLDDTHSTLPQLVVLQCKSYEPLLLDLNLDNLRQSLEHYSLVYWSVAIAARLGFRAGEYQGKISPEKGFFASDTEDFLRMSGAVLDFRDWFNNFYAEELGASQNIADKTLPRTLDCIEGLAGDLGAQHDHFFPAQLYDSKGDGPCCRLSFYVNSLGELLSGLVQIKPSSSPAKLFLEAYKRLERLSLHLCLALDETERMMDWARETMDYRKRFKCSERTEGALNLVLRHIVPVRLELDEFYASLQNSLQGILRAHPKG